jgi:hypothetical protein
VPVRRSVLKSALSRLLFAEPLRRRIRVLVGGDWISSLTVQAEIEARAAFAAAQVDRQAVRAGPELLARGQQHRPRLAAG